MEFPLESSGIPLEFPLESSGIPLESSGISTESSGISIKWKFQWNYPFPMEKVPFIPLEFQ